MRKSSKSSYQKSRDEATNMIETVECFDKQLVCTVYKHINNFKYLYVYGTVENMYNVQHLLAMNYNIIF